MRLRATASITVSLLFVSIFAPAAHVTPAFALSDPATTCQAAVGSALYGYKKARIKAWTKCLEATLSGNDCDEAARDAAIAAAAGKAREKIETKCEGAVLFDAAPDGVGFASSCQMKTGDLTAHEQSCAAMPVSTAAELADCLTCWKAGEIHRLLKSLYPCLAVSIPEGAALDCGVAPVNCPDYEFASGREAIRCLNTISRAGARWFLAGEKILEKCLNARRSGKITAACPDAKSQEKLEAARLKATTAIAAKCETAPAFWSVCPIDPTGACDQTLATTAAIGECIVDGAEEVAEGLVCQQYPDADADGISCPSTCESFSSTDTCNGVDDDCDSGSADGSEDPQVGQSCDGADGDQCLEGVYACGAGSLACSDSTGTTAEVCNQLDDDCDGTTDEDFVRNTNPTCAGAGFLGTIAGDAPSSSLNVSSFEEEWYRIFIREDDGATQYLSATVSLTSPANTNFDLVVHCASCAGPLAGTSSISGSGGHVDTVDVRKDDSFGSPDDFDIYVEVRFVSASSCANWSLSVNGDTVVGAATCP